MRFSFKDNQESGNSIVEMLGVLVVAGILTLGSISMYQYAVDSSHANTIVSEARMRMVALSRHGASKDEATSQKTLKGFWKKPEGDFILDKYQVTLLSQSSGEGPVINISNISSGVCNRLKSMSAIPLKLNNEEKPIAVCGAENTTQFDLTLLDSDPEYSASGGTSHGGGHVSSANGTSEVSSTGGGMISSGSNSQISSTGSGTSNSSSFGGGCVIDYRDCADQNSCETNGNYWCQEYQECMANPFECNDRSRCETGGEYWCQECQ